MKSVLRIVPLNETTENYDKLESEITSDIKSAIASGISKIFFSDIAFPFPLIKEISGKNKFREKLSIAETKLSQAISEINGVENIDIYIRVFGNLKQIKNGNIISAEDTVYIGEKKINVYSISSPFEVKDGVVEELKDLTLIKDAEQCICEQNRVNENRENEKCENSEVSAANENGETNSLCVFLNNKGYINSNIYGGEVAICEKKASGRKISCDTTFHNKSICADGEYDISSSTPFVTSFVDIEIGDSEIYCKASSCGNAHTDDNTPVADESFFDFACSMLIEKYTDEKTYILRSIYVALAFAFKAYVKRNNFSKAILGLSGGIDSALCAAIAVDAIGNKNVFGVLMPSKVSTSSSIEDATDLASRLNIETKTVEIEPLVSNFVEKVGSSGLALENLQARMRAIVLMNISNSNGALVISTGNKSESTLGYATLYGDMAGGISLIKDLKKTFVWKLSEVRNEYAKSVSQEMPITPNSISKEPSAELREGQKDTDSLPPYNVTDGLIELIIENNKDSDGDEVKAFCDKNNANAETVNRFLNLYVKTAYKRLQAVGGPKVTNYTYGVDEHMPSLAGGITELF